MATPRFSSAPVEEQVYHSKEGADQGVDPVSGAVIYRLTSGPQMNHNIYCEQPYSSPDGKRVVTMRSSEFTFTETFALVVVQLDVLRNARVERAIPAQIAHNAWAEWLYYGTHEGGVRRVSLLTLAKEQVLPDGAFTPGEEHMGSITPDNSTIFLEALQPGVDTADRRIIALNTKTGARKTIFADADNVNGHVQCEPTKGETFLMQLVRHRPGQPSTVPVIAMNLDGSNMQQLPIGSPHGAESSGHMAWITGTPRVACAIGWDRENRKHDPRHPKGNLAIAAPGDESPTFFAAPEHGFYHMSSSRCGKYFVADDFMNFKADQFGQTGLQGPAPVVIGNFATGKYRVIVSDCKLQGIAGNSSWEPDPYLTADSRHVIFNGSPLGVNQVFAAKLPEGFLKSLD